MKLLPYIFFLPLIFGFSFSPMSQSIDLGSKQKSAQFQISNESNEKIAVELTVKKRTLDSEGKEILPDTKEITIFPPQMIIPPKEKRTVRVNYNGDTAIISEKAFRVIAEQLPLKVDEKTKKKSGIQMLMKYMAALYVTPEGAEANIQVVSYEFKNSSIELVVKNSGSKHQILLDPVLSFEAGGKKVGLQGKDLEGFAGENVLAESQRVLKIKTNSTVPHKANVTLKIND